ncbi:MAG: asparagine synthase (glutamine-hydrolyzing) [Magnetococcus sp. THC-1_WYH]
MCGLSGYLLTRPGLSNPEMRATLAGMVAALRHRGPDDHGAWVSEHAGVALGHARLAIVDLSSAGHQPMVSASGRYVFVLNGEIYNHNSLRNELECAGGTQAWRGHSDTETLLAGFDHWGVEATLTRCVGMFAIALWDEVERKLTLVRDRMGEKPLYYGWAGRGSERAFVFGSELKALRAYPGFEAEVCRGALAQYLRFTYVPAPRSIYEGVFKLEPGCLLTVRDVPPVEPPSIPLRPGQHYQGLAVQRWWSLANIVEAGVSAPLRDEHEAVQELEAQLNESVRIQSLADVPLGAFLSGGVDSSTIVALMQRQSSRAVQTFTIGFDEVGFDESPYARAVAQHLGTEHHEMRITARTAQDVIPKLAWMYDEPFADSSQIPTHLVCAAARQHVTVALSGDAGDELFGGYNRYFWGPRIWQRLAWLPLPLRKAFGQALVALPPAAWDAVGRHTSIARLSEKVEKLAVRLQTVRDIDDLYRSLVSEWRDPSHLVVGANGTTVVEPPSLLDESLPRCGVNHDAARMMYRDSMTYLPDDILCKVDRAAMAVSLETRVPFLDHRVVELAWRLPLEMKIRGNMGKWALRQVLYRHVPRDLIERPKAGFGIPVGQWLRGPLKEWAEMLLDEGRLRNDGYLQPEPIRQIWHQHLSGRYDWTPRLWSVLMFQAWLAKRSDVT